MDGRLTTPTLARLRETRVAQEAVRRWLRRVVPVLVVLLGASAARAKPRPGDSGRGLVVSIALAGFAIALIAVWRTYRVRTHAQAIWTGVLLASSLLLMATQPGGPGSVGVFLAVVFVARLEGRRLAVALPAVALLILAVIAAVSGRGPGVALLGVLGGLVGMVALAGRLAEANAQAEQLLVELERSRATEARAASLAERQRLAREMHDVLAHSLSGLVLQLEGARMLARDDPADPRLPEAVERAHRLGKSGLEEARHAIGMLRDDDQQLPGPERLPDLAARFEHDWSIPCRLTVSGPQRTLDPDARLALYRVAQEALTNISKHARPERIELHLTYTPSGTELTIEDFTAGNGPAAPAARDEREAVGGYGLTGMRERARLLGGTLAAEQTETGFRVELQVPA